MAFAAFSFLPINSNRLISTSEPNQPLQTYINKLQVTSTVHAEYKPSNRDARMLKRSNNSINIVAKKSSFRNRNSYVKAGVFHITHKASLKRYGAERSIKAQYKEIISLWDNDTFQRVLSNNISNARRKKVIRSLMILRKK